MKVSRLFIAGLLSVALFGIPTRFSSSKALAADGCALIASGSGSHNNSTNQMFIEIYDLLTQFSDIPSRLAKGLSVTLINQVEMQESEDFVFGCRILYDLWDEKFTVTPIVGGLLVKQQASTQKSLKELPEGCIRARLPKPLSTNSVHLLSRLDPVSDEQIQKTRKWLAERGVANGSGPLLSRAAYAIIDLKQEKAVARDCSESNRSGIK